MEKKMFYGANPLLFEKAKNLRNKLTTAEMALWGYLKTNPSGHKFRRQHPIGIYIVDFFCYKLKLVIEVDGLIHEKEEIKKDDEEREKIIRAEGIKLIRFTNNEVMQQIEKVIVKIQSLLHE
jgi:cyclase